MKTLLFLLLLVTLTLPAQTATWSNDGWVVKASYTNPMLAMGSTITIPATIGIEVGGIPQVIEATTDQFTMVMPTTPVVATKIWTSVNVLNTGFTLSEVSGDGTATFDANGKLVIRVNAPNDGNIHTVQFKLKSVLPSWIVKYIPGVKQYLASRLKY